MFTALFASVALTAGADWSATFGPKETGSYLDAHAKLIVVPSGTPPAPAKEASAALVNALRQSGQVDLVMTAEPLGDVSALDDQAIVKKAAALPLTLIAVVRVFPGAADQPLTAVVSLYDKAGATTGALSAMSGQPLAARPASSTAEGVSSQAVSAISDIRKDAVEGSKKTEEEYDLEFIGFNDGVTVNARTGQVVSTWSVPYQGKYRKPLEGGDFYKALDRDDLLKKYETENKRRETLVTGGLVCLGGALLSPFIASAFRKPTDDYDVINTGVVPGLVLLASGFGLVGAGFSINPNPITPPEARQLVEQHNTELRKKLGLPPLQASLDIGGGRLGLHLSGAF